MDERNLNSRHGNSRLIFLISGPSGVGKTTVVQRLLETIPEMAKIVTTTSRSRRPGEQGGVHYHFVSTQKFQDMIDHSKFIEWKSHLGHFYGLTWLAFCETSGRNAILDVDTQGKEDIIRRVSNRVVTIFLTPPSLDEAKDRLVRRGDLPNIELELRLDKARQEVQSAGEYDHIVENAVLDSTVDKICAIIADEILKQDN